MTVTEQQAPPSALRRFGAPIALLVVMWAVQLADSILPGSFSGFGIRSWDPAGLVGILFAPLLHASWPHLIGNSAPFLVLGCLVAVEGTRRFWAVTLFATVVGGLGAWIVNAPGTLTVGASGLVFGYFAYLVVRVISPRPLPHRIAYAVIAIIVILLYGGSILTGIIAAGAGVSWQAHLFGGIGGALAALVGSRRAGVR